MQHDGNVRGVRLVADVRGADPPIIFVGGTGMPAYAWDLFGLSAFLDAGYRNAEKAMEAGYGSVAGFEPYK